MRRVIAIVDDDPQICRMLVRLISLLGNKDDPFDFVTYTDPVDAARELPGIQNLIAIFTDFNMPGITGIKLAEKVIKHAPVVMICATISSEQDDEIARLMREGVLYAWIEKPPERQKISEILLRITLERERKSQPPGPAEPGDEDQ